MVEHPNQNLNEQSGASARKLWFRSDIVIILVLLVVAAVIYLVYAAATDKSGQAYCELIIDGELVETVALSKNKSFSPDRLPHVVFEIKDGAIAFAASDCPDKVCINSGYLHMAGQTAACLPNRAVIRIKSDGGADTPDIVV